MFSELAQSRKFRILVYVVLALVAVGLAAYTHLAYTQARFMWQSGSTISVQGKAERLVKPDVATFTFSVMAEDKDAKVAQDKSAETSNAIIAFLKEQGVEEKDIKTVAYNLNPKYEYETTMCDSNAYWQGACPPGKQTLVGYTVDQMTEVKVRNLDKAGDLLSGVGGKGATNVGSLAFKVDDPDAVREEARAEAIKDAKEKAKRLANDLGVRRGRLINFYEEGPMMPYDYGYGGGMYAEKAMDMGIAPSVNPGEQEIVVTVNLIYEIR